MLQAQKKGTWAIYRGNLLELSLQHEDVCVCSVNHVWLSVTPWTVIHQAALSMEFSRREHWSRLKFPPPGDLPDPGIELMSLAFPALTGGFFFLNHWAIWEAQHEDGGRVKMSTADREEICVWYEVSFFNFWGTACYLVLLPVMDSSEQQNTKWEIGSDQDNMNYGHQWLKYWLMFWKLWSATEILKWVETW